MRGSGALFHRGHREEEVWHLPQLSAHVFKSGSLGGMARSETTRYVCAMRTAAIMVLAITTSWANDMNCKSSS